MNYFLKSKTRNTATVHQIPEEPWHDVILIKNVTNRKANSAINPVVLSTKTDLCVHARDSLHVRPRYTCKRLQSRPHTCRWPRDPGRLWDRLHESFAHCSKRLFDGRKCRHQVEAGC